MDKITVLLLAAGHSKRFWPLGDKHLQNFLAKPLMYYSIEQLKRWGFKNLIIIANKNNLNSFTKLKSTFPEINIKIVVQSEKPGMAGAVWEVREYIKDKEILIVGPSDIFEDILIYQFKEILTRSKPDGVLTGITMDTYYPGGYLSINFDKIIGITEKPNPKKLPSNIVNFVFDYFRNGSTLLEAINIAGLKDENCFENAIDYMVKNGKIFKLLHYKGFIGYLKYPWHALNVTSYFLDKLKEKRGKNIHIDNSAKIYGKVVMEGNVQILENAKIIGPSFLGNGTVIGNNTLIRESMIGENCIVGFNTEITRSYIGNNCWFHSNYIGDSIINNNVGMGAGAITANFKLDENIINSEIGLRKIPTGKLKLGAIIGDNVRIGINTSIMPGIKIGKNCIVGSGVTLNKDLLERTYCKLVKNSYEIKKNLSDLPDKGRTLHRNKLKFS